MRRVTVVALGALALSGCTGTHIKAPAVCDGKHRRPANLYGSILPTLPVPLPASQSGGQSAVVPGSGAGPAPLPAPPAPAPQSAPTPNAGSAPAEPPANGDADTPTAKPRTSQRSDPQSYFSC
jgi:hypothetical protein